MTINTEPETHLKGTTPVDRLIEICGQSVRWLAAATVLLQFLVVLARYLFDIGSVMAQEAILYLFGTMFMLALADTLANDRHVRVDIFYASASNKIKRRIDALGVVLFLLPFTGFLFWQSLDYVARSWRVFEGSREAAGLPGVFLLKTVIPISLALVLLQGIMILFRCLTWKDNHND